jgi:hypothetical protein
MREEICYRRVASRSLEGEDCRSAGRLIGPLFVARNPIARGWIETMRPLALSTVEG